MTTTTATRRGHGSGLREEPPLDLDAIGARAAAATQGPWELARGVRRHSDGVVVTRVVSISRRDTLGRFVTVSDHTYSCDPDADADFVTHAREDVPRLVARVRELESELAAARESLAEWVLVGVGELVDAEGGS